MAATLTSTGQSTLLLHGGPHPGSLLPSHARSAAPLSFNLKRLSSSPAKGLGLRLARRPGRLFCSGGSDGSPPASPSDLVNGFYSSVNDKDMKRLRELLSEDCSLEDSAFSKPFRGRKEVVRFFEKLTEAMGKNVKIVPESVHEGKNATAAAVWHLEWKGERIPFSRGCGFYECSLDEERLLIGRALVIVESPIKPGEFVVELLKLITFIFDKFPNFAEKFLQKPYAAIQFIMKIYKLFVEPLILPFLLYYLHMWGRLLQAIRSLFKFLVKIFRMFM